MSDYKPKVGDRVRVVLEGEVTDTAGGSVTISDRALRGSDPVFWCSSTVADDAKFLVSVEKVEPPVEFFKPGDVVRDTRNGMLYALSTEGYIYLKDGEFVRKYNGEYSGGPFTSKNCEKVNLG